ncbi:MULTISPECIES: hypothetical protein [unclassified Brachybacterium]|uniref:hypothetical protein n=1 Tax=unclassified Brachybacterium TaxID=2623841 RepID=UPI000C806FCE|nr:MULTISPECIES: hypothetical protein [unclassified Brachybacterium]PMC75578.1 hypothetical protein CJ197_07490 [Brachybacterium sp. UMB0905]
MTSTPRSLRALSLRLLICAAVIALAAAVGRMVGLLFPLPYLVTFAVLAAVLWWLFSRGSAASDSLDFPAYDLDGDYALPHGQDQRVRRLEDLVHGALPGRRMTQRGLAMTLGRIAAQRPADAPPLSPDLTAWIDSAANADAQQHPVRPVDRRTLHRYLRELAAGEEGDR